MLTLPTWRQMNMDTPPAVEERYFAQLRELPSWRKAEMLEGVNQMVWDLTLLGIQQRHPAASEAEIRQRFARALLGDELAQRFLAATGGA